MDGIGGGEIAKASRGGPQSRYDRLRRQVHGGLATAIPPIWLLACIAVLESVALAQNPLNKSTIMMVFLPRIGLCAVRCAGTRAGC